MKINDVQLGRPSVLYCETHTNILAVPYPVEGMLAWDTTNHKQYAYNSTAWVLTTADWNTLDNKPATFPPSAHTHSEYVDGTIERNPHYVLAGPASGIIATAPDWRALVSSDFMPQQGVITGDPTGFTSPADVIVTYDPTTQKVTLTGTVVAYWQGAIIPVLTSGWLSTAHPNVTGHRYYLSYNGSSFVWGDNTSWDFKQLQIAYVNYGATDKYAIRECHGLMPWQAHEEFHETIGAYKEKGGALTWAGAIPSDTTAANRRPDVAETVMHDEDLITTNAALTSKLYTKCYLTSTNTLNYTVETAEIISVTGAIPNYNLYTGGAWTQQPMTANTYTCVWLIAVPVTASVGSQKYRYLWFQGQSAGALAAQQALTPSDVNLGTLAADATEFVFLAKIIINYRSAGGGNWVINSVTTLTGNHFQQVGSATAGFLTEVTTDATLSGVGTVGSPLTIPNAAITLAKMANIATASVIGRATAGTGVPEILTQANVRTIIGAGIGNGLDADTLDTLHASATQDANAHVVATDAAGNIRVFGIMASSAYGAHIYRGTTYTLATATLTAVSYSNALYDAGSIWSAGSPTRLTPLIAGYYIAGGGMTVQAVINTSANRWLNAIRKNGNDFPGAWELHSVANQAFTTGGATGYFYMNGTTDYMELIHYQNSGGNRLIEAANTTDKLSWNHFWIARIA